MPKTMKKHNKQKRKQQVQKSRTLALTWVPPQLNPRRMTLCYSNHLAIQESAANAGVFKTLVLNGLYDADVAYGSTYTVGFVEMSAMFKSYRVWGTRVRFSGGIYSADIRTVAQVTLTPNANNTTLPASTDKWSAQFGSISKVVPPIDAGGANNMFVLDKTFDIPKLLGITRAQYLNERDYSGLSTANPTLPVYCMLTCAGISCAVATTLKGLVQVSFDVEFFNPFQLSA